MSSDEDPASSSGSEEEDEVGEMDSGVISEMELQRIRQRTAQGKRRNSVSAESTASVMYVMIAMAM
jgi:hypothetical protein|eukprot:COSAG01_NODE_4485_length_4983_cov_3.863432_7_plen_66_part_00